MKLGIIVPYRNREAHLKLFRETIDSYLKSQKIEYELIVVEQIDDMPFNRGKLLNIGFEKAKKLNCKYVAFHDVDMLPIKVDYSFSEVPVHLASAFDETSNVKRIVFDEYFGGITLFPINVFEQINGYSNEYWGWGFEDDDLLYRCKQSGVVLDTKNIKIENSIKGLYFNGKNSYIEVDKLHNIFDFKNTRSIAISFKSDDIICNPNKEWDDYTLFSIPGYDTNISYNSFKRYKVETWDSNKSVHSINTEILTNTYTTIIFILDFLNSTIKMYKDGEFIGEKSVSNTFNRDGKLVKQNSYFMDYSEEPSFFIGCGDAYRNTDANWFKGVITNFAVYDGELTANEIKAINENKMYPLSENFKQYKSASKLLCYYDFSITNQKELIDLSLNGNNVKTNNTHLVDLDISEYNEVYIPKRRKSLIKLLSHKENGFENGNWKSKNTRQNQIKFFNNISRNLTNTDLDGLSNCKYKLVNEVSVKNSHHLSVLL